MVMLRLEFAGMISDSCTFPQYFINAMLIGDVAVKKSLPFSYVTKLACDVSSIIDGIV